MIVHETGLGEVVFFHESQFISDVCIVVFVRDAKCQVVSTEHIIQVERLCLLERDG